MPRPIHATIHPAALAHNLAVVARRISPQGETRRTRIWGVIKANAYGHGIERVLPGLAAADGLASLQQRREALTIFREVARRYADMPSGLAAAEQVRTLSSLNQMEAPPPQN